MAARRSRLSRSIGWILALPPWWLWCVAIVVGVAWAFERFTEALAAVGVIVVVAVAVTLRQRLRRPVIIDWQDAEQATAAWLRQAGCRRVVMTGAGADAGIDVLTSDWAVQVKHTARRVGRPAVQQLVGAALSRDLRSALFSTSGFSAPAFDYADEHQVALFELGLDGRARALNRTAHQVGKRRRRVVF